MTLTDIVMTIGGTRSSAMPTPLTTPTAQPPTRISGTIQISGAVSARGEGRHQDGGAVQDPGHAKVDAAADDDDRLPDRDDAGEGGERDQRRHMGGDWQSQANRGSPARTAAAPRRRRAGSGSANAAAHEASDHCSTPVWSERDSVSAVRMTTSIRMQAGHHPLPVALELEQKHHVADQRQDEGADDRAHQGRRGRPCRLVPPITTAAIAGSTILRADGGMSRRRSGSRNRGRPAAAKKPESP